MTAIDSTSTASPHGALLRGPLTALSDIATMAAREIRRTLRSADALITAFVIPVSIMLVFVVIFGGALDADGHYVDYVVPGVLVLCLGFGSASTAVAVAQDVKGGMVNRVKTFPVHAPSVLHGHVIASVLRNLAACVPVTAVALLLGFRPAASFGGWLAAIGYGVLVIISFTWLSALGGLLLSVDAAASINFVFLFLPYISSGFVGVDTMPSWLQGFADHQPYTPIIETLRSLLAGTAPGTDLWAALAWLLGILAVGVVGASVLFVRKVKG